MESITCRLMMVNKVVLACMNQKFLYIRVVRNVAAYAISRRGMNAYSFFMACMATLQPAQHKPSMEALVARADAICHFLCMTHWPRVIQLYLTSVGPACTGTLRGFTDSESQIYISSITQGARVYMIF